MSKGSQTTKKKSDAEVWLVEGLNGGGSAKAKTRKRVPKRLASDDRRVAKQPNGRVSSRRLAARLRSTERKLESYERRERELEEEVDELQADLLEEKKKSRAKLNRLRAQMRSGKVEIPKGKLDANNVSFDQLRALGLSVTQSANLIKRRESNGGFRSAAELKKIPGLSQSARKTLTARLRVSR